ncbi:glycosyltransferase family 10 domain-containing protein [Agrobacterium rosae]|uniref:glycosyltransferase family 10 domain-containing protein n=1 Tax=Agrobacterium rosae TaxID=1972867 RepID=UPI002A1043D1|nr:glycosyltransferase family 10 [Agrobacterium rosae]MDX8313039.1 glycosyltransferase family 10 [Agrobacterium rosae]
MLIKAGFISSSSEWQWERQFPDNITVWNGVDFIFSGDFHDCDVLFVFDAIPLDMVGKIHANRSVFIASEPASIKTYHPDFLNQFDFVLTTDTTTRHRNVSFGQIGSPWHIGAWDNNGHLLSTPMNYRNFETLSPPKTKSISVVSSNKARTEGHRARLEFVQKLKSYFGTEIDVFGRNINGFGDKSEVLNDYRYHIAIENSCYPDYWTEKLADPYLSLTYPIYYGCPNITDYFSKESLAPIDIANPENAIVIIRDLIESDRAETARPHLEESRRRVLNEHNLFSILSVLTTDIVKMDRSMNDLEAEKYFSRWKYRLKRRSIKNLNLLSKLLFNKRSIPC